MHHIRCFHPKSLNEGNSIEMLTGPFANFIATVDTIDPEQRIWVLMDFMGQKHAFRSVLMLHSNLDRPQFEGRKGGHFSLNTMCQLFL